MILGRFLVYTCLVWHSAARASEADFSADNERIFQVSLSSRYQVNDALLAYEAHDRLYLPFEEFSYGLGFSVSTFATQKRVEGFFRSPDQSFVLNLQTCEFQMGKIFLKGEVNDEVCSLGEIWSDEVYVDSTFLEKWMDIKLQIFPLKSSIVVESLKPVPVEQRLLEEQDRKEALGRRKSSGDKTTRVQDAVTENINGPFLDFNMFSGSDRRSGVNGFVGVETYGLENSFRYSLASDVPSALKYTLSRRNPDGDRFGPFEVRQLYLNDIFIPETEGVLPSRSARGVYVSNFPLDFSGGFSSITIRGSGDPAWVVELYQSSVLIAATQTNELGEYEFLSVPINYGDNVYRILMRGPQGQRKEEYRTFSIASTNPGAGNLYYSTYAAKTVPASEFGLETHYGISKNVSWTSMLLHERPDSNARPRTFVGQGLSAYFSLFSPSIEAILDNESAYVVKPGLRFLISRGSLDLRYSYVKNFDSEYYQRYGGYRLRHLVESTFNTFLEWPIPLGLRLASRRSYFIELPNYYQEDELILSVGIGWAQLQNRLRWSHGGAQNRITGKTQIQKGFGYLQVGLGAEYTTDRFTGVGGDISWQSRKGEWSTRISADHTFAENETKASVAIARVLRTMDLGTQFVYGPITKFSAYATLATSFGRNSAHGTWHIHARQMSDRSSIAVRTFADKNYNGIYDVGEPAMPHTIFRLNNRSDSYRTDSNGLAYLPSLSPFTNYQISVDADDLFEKNMSATKIDYMVYTEPMRTYRLDIPISYAMEVEGLVEVEGVGGLGKPARNRELYLRNVDSNVITKIKSEFDGYYLFENIRPGRYLLSVKKSNDEVVIPESADLILREGDKTSPGINFMIKK